MFTVLLLWAVVGVVAFTYLWDDGYFEDVHFQTLATVCLVCGPATIALFLVWAFIGFIQLLVILLER